jgi:hypothetical protein
MRLSEEQKIKENEIKSIEKRINVEGVHDY